MSWKPTKSKLIGLGAGIAALGMFLGIATLRWQLRPAPPLHLEGITKLMGPEWSPVGGGASNQVILYCPNDQNGSVRNCVISKGFSLDDVVNTYDQILREKQKEIADLKEQICMARRQRETH